jgi:hypothetical protein
MTDPSDEIHVNSAYVIPGLASLTEPTVSLLSDRNASVWLTVEPEGVLFDHVDRSEALRTLFFTGGLTNSFEERFTSAIAQARSVRKQRAGSDMPTPANFSKMRANCAK